MLAITANRFTLHRNAGWLPLFLATTTMPLAISSGSPKAVFEVGVLRAAFVTSAFDVPVLANFRSSVPDR